MLARKPLIGTVVENVLEYGTGAMNIDGCRLSHSEECRLIKAQAHGDLVYGQTGRRTSTLELKPNGRWPANVIHDGSDEVLAAFAAFGKKASGGVTHQPKRSGFAGFVKGRDEGTHIQRPPDTGTAARFFYCAQASQSERAGSKPISLMRYLCRLVTPQGGTVLDPFASTGITGQAAIDEGFNLNPAVAARKYRSQESQHNRWYRFRQGSIEAAVEAAGL